VDVVLAADDLYRFYHTRDAETRALRGVSFAVAAGEFVALMGPSGSGKSTLLSCLAGLDVPDGGQVILMGERIARLSETERARRRRAYIGILMQSRNLLMGLTAEENVRLPLIMDGQDGEERAEMLLRDLGVWERRRALPAELSGGEAARVGLAVALGRFPSVLLADEPTAEVDAATEKDLTRLLAGRCASGMAAVVATHSHSLAEAAARVIQIRDGRIIDDASARRG
jgi:putative ABC transport system ATP-binding protein